MTQVQSLLQLDNEHVKTSLTQNNHSFVLSVIHMMTFRVKVWQISNSVIMPQFVLHIMHYSRPVSKLSFIVRLIGNGVY